MDESVAAFGYAGTSCDWECGMTATGSVRSSQQFLPCIDSFFRFPVTLHAALQTTHGVRMHVDPVEIASAESRIQSSALNNAAPDGRGSSPLVASRDACSCKFRALSSPSH